MCEFIAFLTSEYVNVLIVGGDIETIALCATWSALSFPGIPICPGIHMN